MHALLQFNAFRCASAYPTRDIDTASLPVCPMFGTHVSDLRGCICQISTGEVRVSWLSL